MNLENLNTIAERLEAGAEGVTFNMDVSLKQHACGPVCCIAGLACHIATGATKGTFHDGVADAALEWLGLEGDDSEFSHDLFDPFLSPINCTPAQAAKAVRRVMAGEHPWPGQADD